MKFKLSTAVAITITIVVATSATFSDAQLAVDATPAMNGDNDKQKKVCNSHSEKCKTAIKEKDTNKYKFCNRFIEVGCSEIKKIPKIPIDQCVAVVDDSLLPIHKELCVIGGGAAGSYTAYEAQQRGYETVLLEPKQELGGNCEIIAVRSTIDPSVTYNVNAAVILYDPTTTVKAFFSDLNVPTSSFQQEQGGKFVYGIPTNQVPTGVIPAPPIDPQVFGAAVAAYNTAFYQVYNFVDPFLPVPDFSKYTTEQSDALFETFGVFLSKNPGIKPLVPVLSAFVQGYGFIETLPMWEIVIGVPPRFVNQLLASTWLVLPSGCQELYNEVEDRMIQVDAKSVVLNTNVDLIKEMKNGKVSLTTVDTTTQEKNKYECDNAVIAFRPDGLNKETLKSITKEETQFFGDFKYNGYVTTIWKMELGPALIQMGANLNTKLSFTNATTVDVGIVSLEKSRAFVDYPWRCFYQPAKPADTAQKLEQVHDDIVAELTKIGFINIQNIFMKNHKYGLRPKSKKSLKKWVSFFEEKNSNDNSPLYWTGAVEAGDASSYVWEYSKHLLDNRFPAKE